MHLTKFGLVFRRVAINFANCSLYNWLTVLNIPFLVLAPNWVSPIVAAAMPTISAKKRKLNQKEFTSVGTKCKFNKNFKNKSSNKEFNSDKLIHTIKKRSFQGNT